MKVDKKLFVTFGEDVPSPAGAQILGAEMLSTSGQGGGVAVRVVVELYLRHGGVNTRALLGALFTQTVGAKTIVRLHAESEPIWIERFSEVPSNLGGPPLMCGLPSDLASAALDGLTRTGGLALPAGILEVDRAAHSPVDSSERAFNLVADILVHAVAVQLRGEDVDASLDEYLARSIARQ